jgi:hypothetical protein
MSSEDAVIEATTKQRNRRETIGESLRSKRISTESASS